MYRGFLRSMFVCSLLLGLACSLWAKPGREFYASDIRESMDKGDKLAILMVHFGSAYPEARTQVLDVMNKRVKEAFPDEEVRAAYRRMAVKHHPDKVASLGEDIRKAANEKFQKINEAKERIYQSRGLK